MIRRTLRDWRCAVATGSSVVLAVFFSAGAEASDLPPHYAESVAVYGLTPDGSEEVRFRLARFPERGQGAVWLSVFVAGQHYAVVDPTVELDPQAGATPVAAGRAAFRVADASNITVSTTARHTDHMRGEVHAQALAHRGFHPPSGSGEVPVRIEVAFRAMHSPVAARPGRLEVFGTTQAKVTTPEGTFTVEGPGKWHEQTGPRRTFAPSFTYLWGAAADHGLLARGGAGSAWGLVAEDMTVTAVNRLRIDPVGRSARQFEVTLADGRAVTGTAHVLRQSSVPIEGGRRPSATVRIESTLGTMIGHLNDWDPGSVREP